MHQHTFYNSISTFAMVIDLLFIAFNIIGKIIYFFNVAIFYFFFCSMVPVHFFEPHLQAHSFFMRGVCASARVMP